MKILAIGASSSATSINKQLATYTANLIPESVVTTLDLNDFDMPIYSSQYEESEGIPQKANDFIDHIEATNGIVLSLAEHNGSYSAAFKNILDWASRTKSKMWSEKPMLLLATSPGGRGGATVLAAAESYFPRMGADVRATLSLPSFYETFDKEKGITDLEHLTELKSAINHFTKPKTT